MTYQMKLRLIPYTMGEKEAELVIKNATIVDVLTNSLYVGDIAIAEGWIVGIGRYSGKREIDAAGRYVLPGFIDAHMHIESTMLTPSLFSRIVLPFGTTTLIADPHEIVNVAGAEGMQYMLEESQHAIANIFYMLPSSVPAGGLKNNGGVFEADQMEPFLNHPRVLGLGEVMTPADVIGRRPEMMKKIERMNGRPMDGHAPALSGPALQAYHLAGILTDHECNSFEQALERLRSGFYVQVREGSAAKNARPILEGALKAGISFDRFVLCTDDKHPAEIRKEGHISAIIKMAIELGVEPITAYKMATINTANLYGLRDLGAIAPGRRADLVILNNLETVDIAEVYKDGKPLREVEAPHSSVRFPSLLHSVRIGTLPRNCFSLKPRGSFPVILMDQHKITTKLEYMDLPIDGEGEFTSGGDLLKIAVIQRHEGNGRIGVGVIQGFGLKNGAIASTVSHDSHNLVVVGDNDEDMITAVEALKESQGGYALVTRGTTSLLKLPLAGLMNNDPDYDLQGQLESMLKQARKLGVPAGVDPFISLSFMALTVIPEVRITDYGVYDVVQNRLITKPQE